MVFILSRSYQWFSHEKEQKKTCVENILEVSLMEASRRWLVFSKMSRPSRERINLVASPWRNSLISNNFTTFPAFVSKSIQRVVCALMTGPAFIMANFNLGSATYTHYYKTCTSHPPPWLQNFMTLTLCASEGKPKKYQPHGCCKKCCLPVTTIPHTG